MAAGCGCCFSLRAEPLRNHDRHEYYHNYIYKCFCMPEGLVVLRTMSHVAPPGGSKRGHESASGCQHDVNRHQKAIHIYSGPSMCPIMPCMHIGLPTAITPNTGALSETSHTLGRATTTIQQHAATYNAAIMAARQPAVQCSAGTVTCTFCQASPQQHPLAPRLQQQSTSP